MPPAARMPSAPSGGRGDVGGDVGEAAGGEGERGRADGGAGGGGILLRSAQHADAEGQQHERDGVADLAEGAGDDGVHHGAHGAGHAPPLAGGHDDGEGDEEQADAVAAVLGLEVAAGVADLAGHRTGGVGQAHPGALHGAQRERQAAGAGAVRPLARARGGSPGRRPGRGAPAARRGGRASRHGRRLRESHTGLTCHTRHGGDRGKPPPERGPRPDRGLVASVRARIRSYPPPCKADMADDARWCCTGVESWTSRNPVLAVS